MNAHICENSKNEKTIMKKFREGLVEAYKAGHVDGGEKVLLFCLTALENIRGGSAKSLNNFLLEVERIVKEAADDPDAFYRMKRKMDEKGVEISGNFFSCPRLLEEFRYMEKVVDDEAKAK